MDGDDQRIVVPTADDAAVEYKTREQLVRALAGSFRYPDGYLDDLRSDWPD